MTFWSEALSFLENHGWVKGVSEDEATGKVCLGRAISESVIDHCYRNGGIPEVLTSDLLRRIEEEVDNSVSGWNDAPQRTWSDVETLLWDLHLKENA